MLVSVKAETPPAPPTPVLLVAPPAPPTPVDVLVAVEVEAATLELADATDEALDAAVEPPVPLLEQATEPTKSERIERRIEERRIGGA